MAQWNSSVLKEAELLLRQKQYREALSRLQLLGRTGLSGEQYGIYCLLLSECYLHLGDYSDICIDEAIEFFRFRADVERFAKAKYLKGWWLSEIGEYQWHK